MEGNLSKISHFIKSGKLKLKVTIMPKNLKIIIGVDPEIQIGIE